MVSQQPSVTDTEDVRFSGLDGWHDYVNAYFPPLEMADRSASGFRAAASSRKLGDYSLTNIGTSASKVERTAALARRADTGYLKIMWQLAGHLELAQDRRTVCLAPGQVAVCDTTRAYRLHASENTRLAVLLVPYDVDSRLPRYVERVSATALAELPILQAALGAITGLARSRPAPDDPGIEDVMHGVGQMLTATLARAAQPDIAELDTQQLRRAEHFVTTHMSDTGLTPNRLAAALCVSRRALYTLLARRDLTPARLIAEIRLCHARDTLAADTREQRSITDIALAHGFSDSARFSHAFKDRFGKAPSLWRSEHADALSAQGSDTLFPQCAINRNDAPERPD